MKDTRKFSEAEKVVFGVMAGCALGMLVTMGFVGLVLKAGVCP